MKNEKVQDYETPEVLVLEVNVEEGYATSSGGEKGIWARGYSLDEFE